MASLTVFTLLWGQLQAAHLMKDFKGDWSSVQPATAALFFLALPACTRPSWRPGLPVLALGSFVYLMTHGSLSNHIMQDLLMNWAILASWLSCLGQEEKLLPTLSRAAHWYLIGLYLITALHKLNDAWLDPKVSCARSVTATLLAQYAPTLLPPESPLAQLVLDNSALAASIFEMLLPVLFLLAGPPWARSDFGLLRRAALILGAFFHLGLALPLPPASFYPFSASCLAIYSLELTSSLDILFEAVAQFLPPFSGLILSGLSIALCAGANTSKVLSAWLRSGEGADAPYEYPPYDLFNAGCCWCLGVTVFLTFVAVFGPSPKEATVPTVGGYFASISTLCGVLALGLTPYLGVRTYPAFAMFSNLRVEGKSPNHLFLGGGADIFHFQRDSVRILEAKVPELHNFQVDLAILYTNRTKDYMRRIELQPALWICPPVWKNPPAEFVPFDVPAVALRQRLLQIESKKDWRKGGVVAKVLRDGRPIDVRSSADVPVTCGGRVPASVCQVLQTWVGPFRSFDEGSSPCRH